MIWRSLLCLLGFVSRLDVVQLELKLNVHRQSVAIRWCFLCVACGCCRLPVSVVFSDG